MQQGAITGKQAFRRMRSSAQTAGLLTVAQGKVTEATAGQRMGMTNLIRQLSDMSTMYSMGARPAMIFSSQIGQVTDAVGQMTGGTSKFASFMAGPWGRALEIGLVVLGPIAAKMLETKDAADKAGAASETMAEKLDTQRHSAQAVTQALREYNAEQKKAKESTLESAQAALVAAQTNVVDALGIRLKLGAQLAASLASAQANAGQGTGGLAGAVAQGEVDKIRAAIAENDKAVQKAMNDRRDAEVNVAEEFANRMLTQS
jgi:hypothetical protein